MVCVKATTILSNLLLKSIKGGSDMYLKDLAEELKSILTNHREMLSAQECEVLENTIRFVSNKPFEYCCTDDEYVAASFVTKEDVVSILKDNGYSSSSSNVDTTLDYLDLDYLGDAQNECSEDYLYDALCNAERSEVLEKSVGNKQRKDM